MERKASPFFISNTMIQRIQTIYLLIVTILGVLLCCYPMAEVVPVEGEIFKMAMGGPLPYSALIVLMPVLSFTTIFLYKKRVLQMRLCSFNIVLSILTMLLSGLYIYMTYKTGSKLTMKWPCVIMPINIILLYLAARAIGKDEALVRSLDRLR